MPLDRSMVTALLNHNGVLLARVYYQNKELGLHAKKRAKKVLNGAFLQFFLPYQIVLFFQAN
jgi:hypothetical protein